MNADNDQGKPVKNPAQLPPEPQLPNPPEPRKSMEIRASEGNIPEPPPPMLSWEEAPDRDNSST
jgi:hypothetical protein